MSVAGADNTDANPNNIILTIKTIKLYVTVVISLARDNQKLSKLHSKGLERSVYWNKYKIKSENKITKNEFKYFVKSNFVGVYRLFVLVYWNKEDYAKRFITRIYYLPKGIIKNYNVINGENFYEHATDSDIKWYEEIRKL